MAWIDEHCNYDLDNEVSTGERNAVEVMYPGAVEWPLTQATMVRDDIDSEGIERRDIELNEADHGNSENEQNHPNGRPGPKSPVEVDKEGVDPGECVMETTGNTTDNAEVNEVTSSHPENSRSVRSTI
jgi:hypothetical protein